MSIVDVVWEHGDVRTTSQWDETAHRVLSWHETPLGDADAVRGALAARPNIIELPVSSLRGDDLVLLRGVAYHFAGAIEIDGRSVRELKGSWWTTAPEHYRVNDYGGRVLVLDPPPGPAPLPASQVVFAARRALIGDLRRDCAGGVHLLSDGDNVRCIRAPHAPRVTAPASCTIRRGGATSVDVAVEYWSRDVDADATIRVRSAAVRGSAVASGSAIRAEAATARCHPTGLGCEPFGPCPCLQTAVGDGSELEPSRWCLGETIALWARPPMRVAVGECGTLAWDGEELTLACCRGTTRAPLTAPGWTHLVLQNGAVHVDGSDGVGTTTGEWTGDACDRLAPLRIEGRVRALVCYSTVLSSSVVRALAERVDAVYDVAHCSMRLTNRWPGLLTADTAALDVDGADSTARMRVEVVG